MFRADLHMHSYFSDGELSPRALIDLAKEKGLSAISITDHDLYEAYSEDVFEYGKAKGVLLLPGVEFSCYEKGEPIHILAYNVEPTSDLISFCNQHTARRASRFNLILDKLESVGLDVRREGVQDKKKGNLGRVFLAQKLLDWGYVTSIKEAFNKYLADRHLKGVHSINFTIAQTVEVIEKSGGKAFLAHPHLIKKKRLLHEILDMKQLSGIECFYGFFPAHVDRQWEKLASEKGLLISGGSDFHGPAITHANMGSSWVDEERARAIFPGRL